MQPRPVTSPDKCRVERGETWNEAHKVVEIIATTPEPDGYRPGFSVDIVTRAIVG